MSDEIFTVSMADFIRVCREQQAADPSQADFWQERIKWGNIYNPLTPVILTPDGRGQLIPSVALGGISANDQAGEATLRLQGREDIDIAALSALAAEYEITDSDLDLMETMLEICGQGGLDLVRQKLEESGLGESAKNLRAARERFSVIRRNRLGLE